MIQHNKIFLKRENRAKVKIRVKKPETNFRLMYGRDHHKFVKQFVLNNNKKARNKNHINAHLLVLCTF